MEGAKYLISSVGLETLGHPKTTRRQLVLQEVNDIG